MNRKNPTYTTWTYNNDDTVKTITDARGAVSTYGYNNRHLVTSVSHALSGLSTISVGYSYDAAGNRISMSHSVGGAAQDSVSYSYDSLSRMTAETRHINALEGSGPNYGDFIIGYNSYSPSNQLQTVTDPFNATTNLSYDTAGRTNGVTGSDSGTNFTYVGTVAYRAWGAVRSRDGATTTFNSRMQPVQFRGSANWMRYDYDYYNDGRLKQIRDLDDQTGDPHQVTFHYMSRAYNYDQAGRISGVAALSSNPNGNIPAPFTGSYGYDAFDNMNSRGGHYALNPDQSDSAAYSNNRRSGWSYDLDGRVTTSTDTSDSGGNSTRTWTYDAAGNEVTVSEVRNSQTITNTLAYDGDGQLIYESVTNGSSVSDYLIRSTVLGSVLTKLDANGSKNTTYVPTNGLVMAVQQKDSQGHPTVRLVQRDASGLQEDGQAYDPFGNLISNVQPPVGGPPGYTPTYGPPYGFATSSSFINANNFGTGCQIDGVAQICSKLWQAMGSMQIGTISISGPGAVDVGGLGIVPERETNGDFSSSVANYLRPVFGDDPQNSYDPREDFRHYAKVLSWDGRKTDCLKLALLIYKAGQVFGGSNPSNNSGSDIIHGLMSGLTEYTAVTFTGRQGPSDHNYRLGVFRNDPHYGGSFGDSGFARHFQDNSNQVRHFTFYLGAGWGIGSTAANYGLHQEESTNDPRVADVGLGWVATDLGSHFNGNYRQLAQDVWHRVCGQSSNLNLP